MAINKKFLNYILLNAIYVSLGVHVIDVRVNFIKCTCGDTILMYCFI